MSINISAESGASVIVGDENKVTIDNSKNININSEDLMNELQLAIEDISKSNELSDEEKISLISVMEAAKNSIKNDSEKDKKEAKNAFSLIKGFMVGKAPKLLESLANMAQLAVFFGIQPPTI